MASCGKPFAVSGILETTKKRPGAFEMPAAQWMGDAERPPLPLLVLARRANEAIG